MTKTATIVGTLTGLLVGLASSAGAQTTPAPLTQGYVNINLGAQPATRTFTMSDSFSLYGETATFEAVHHVGHGPVLDISGGKRLRSKRLGENFAIGAGFSKIWVDKDVSSVRSSVPSPIVSNSPQVQTQTVPDLNHKETGFYVQAVYIMPMTTKIDIALGAGPMFFNVKQDLVSRIDVPARTQAAVPIVETQSKTAVGANISFDGSYLFTPRIGAGLFIRYAGASTDLDPGGVSLKVGGFQAGLGARLRF